MACGSGILLWVGMPIVIFSVYQAPQLLSIISPLQMIEQKTSSDNQSEQVFAADTIVSSSQGTDFTNPNLWFPNRPQKKVVTPVNTYLLSIPKLKIDKAHVVIGGDDLNNSLVHYGGTGLPGEYGNAVIFGHSVLPQFFNPQNYRTIFSTLPTLEVGDDAYITFDRVTYRYRVDQMIVRDPTDLAALEQRYDDSYITLITCVPPGTYWKRLNVRAKLVALP